MRQVDVLEGPFRGLPARVHLACWKALADEGWCAACLRMTALPAISARPIVLTAVR